MLKQFSDSWKKKNPNPNLLYTAKHFNDIEHTITNLTCCGHYTPDRSLHIRSKVTCAFPTDSINSQRRLKAKSTRLSHSLALSVHGAASITNAINQKNRVCHAALPGVLEMI